MSEQNYIYKAALAVGDGKGKKNNRPYRIEGRDFTQAAQSTPVPVTWGTARRSGLFLFPIFNFRSRAIRQEAGGK